VYRISIKIVRINYKRNKFILIYAVNILFISISFCRFMIMIVFCILIVATIALDNGLGKTPPMGWNSWNRFHCDINETLIKETVDLLISTGLADKGYKYVNLDDCWQIDRNKTTN
jgi:hypothetical protein